MRRRNRQVLDPGDEHAQAVVEHFAYLVGAASAAGHVPSDCAHCREEAERYGVPVGAIAGPMSGGVHTWRWPPGADAVEAMGNKGGAANGR